MKRIHIFAEGYTELEFLNKLIFPFLYKENPSLSLTSSVIKTSKDARGGLVNYHKVRNEIIHKCQETSHPFVTTMFDLFKLPKDFPERRKADSIPDSMQKAKYLEKAMNEDIGFNNFFANFTIHEFEALLFSDPQKFTKRCDNRRVVESLVRIREQFKSPEDINGGAETAPSKRIKNLHSQYKKVIDGIAIAEAIGLEKICRECPHFSTWVKWLSEPCNTDSTKQTLKETQEVQ